ncbi:MAG: SMC-Scp complex subunit ScpB [Parcubacteria group bacterium]|nr:SMC-Scp complex subunit ScpB [Parcubacteria group bacterium]
MDIESILESLLFASGEPMTVSELSELLKKPSEVVEQALTNLEEYYRNNNRGVRLIKNNDRWLMTINSEANPYLNKLKKEVFEGDLSPAASETLAIIAYRGPLSRAEINEIRGVDSSYILHQLLLRELIERFPNPQRANSFLYNISFKLLNHLGLTKIEELPNYEELHKKSFG